MFYDGRYYRVIDSRYERVAKKAKKKTWYYLNKKRERERNREIHFQVDIIYIYKNIFFDIINAANRSCFPFFVFK